MTDFTKFSKAVEKQFNKMAEGDLFKVDVDPYELYNIYLSSFPDGTDPIYRENTAHDCSCCRNFIKNLGSVVSIVNNKVVTVWDVVCEEYPYDIVAKEMDRYVKKHPIKQVFSTKETKYGNESNIELLSNGKTHTWNHFVGNIPVKHCSQTPSKVIGEADTTFKVFKRSLEEVSVDAIGTVLGLIGSNSLYRGEEHSGLVTKFREKKKEFDNHLGDKDLFIWKNLHLGSICRFRNTVIGTLIMDLTNDVPLEDAVKMFESKVAPANYKRPKALITPKMVEQAMETIKELDLESALDRRHATFSDVSVEDVLFVDNDVRPQMKGGLEEALLSQVKTKSIKTDGATNIFVGDFVKDILPQARKIEALVKNKDLPKMFSLTSPVNSGVKPLFKWDNNFAWSYDGNLADSDIKQRVKQAGGNVDALFRVSLGWFNYDDLDIHVKTPKGQHIYYQNKAGILDVDMNAGGGDSRTPVENTCWTKDNLVDGAYVFSVNNYSKRESIDIGFSLELEFDGMVEKYHYHKPVANKQTVDCLKVVIKNGQLESVDRLNNDLTSETTSQEKWGIKTETFTEVSSVILSPNHWGENNIGNKHLFFILKDCINPDPVRGIYNEFLNPALEKHRKVFEIIGDKTKCQATQDQMSGIGISSTQKNSELTVKVGFADSKKQQVYNIQF